MVDILGSLSTAVKVTEKGAGSRGEEYELVEFLPKSWFNFGGFIAALFEIENEVEIEKDPSIEDLKFRIKHNGHSMPVMPMSDIELLK